jgi:UDP-glucose 4-epimerase
MESLKESVGASPVDRRWVVTGANGYLGERLCSGLRERRVFVGGVARVGQMPESLQNYGIASYDYEDIPSVLSRGDVLVHCAGLTGGRHKWEDFVHVNVDWPLKLFREAKKCQADCFVYISSIATLGYRNRLDGNRLNEFSDSRLRYAEFYGRSKLLAEQALQKCAINSATRLIILRPGLIYGRRPMAIVGSWFRRGITVDPGQRVPLVHIDSFLDAVIRVVGQRGLRGVFVVVDDEQPRLKELVDARMEVGLQRYKPWYIGRIGFWSLLGIRTVVRWLRRDCSIVPRGYARTEFDLHVRRLNYDTEKLRSTTGWEPLVSLEEGLRTGNMADIKENNKVGNDA